MAASQLKEAFLHLSQHSVDSVQNGKAFTNWDEYMHVERPIESKLKEKMEEIIRVHYGDIDRNLCEKALDAFYEIRKMDELQKKPSTSELLDWIQALMISGVDIDNLSEDMPFVGVLLKKNQDIDVMQEIKEKGYSLRRW